jgi:hypothetical protein
MQDSSSHPIRLLIVGANADVAQHVQMLVQFERDIQVIGLVSTARG